MKPTMRSLAWLAWLWAGAALAQSPQVIDLATRPGVTQRVLVLQPEQPAAVLVLMTGGSGRLGIFDNGSLRNDGNFLVRSRSLFVQQGFAVVLPDTPSDHSSPPFLSGDFRESAEHSADLGAVIAWARQRFARPVWIVGTSRGTQSAAAAAVTLAGAFAPDGLVLTSSILSASRFGQSTARPVQDMALDRLRMPVLVAHHEQDQCQVCPPGLLPALMGKLQPGASRLITYQGGISTGPPCEAFAHHGFNGIEAQVVADIAAWITAQTR
jgi:pimeloyl-ACP methyl ester carboxylesterase